MTTEPYTSDTPAVDIPTSPAANAATRLADAFPEGGAPDATIDEPSTAAPGAAPDDDAGLLEAVPDDISYRDALKLREELRNDRARWRPFEDAFGALSDDDRQAILDLAPQAAPELGAFAQLAGTMAPRDRAWFLAAMDAYAENPAMAAQMFGQAAQLLGAPPGAAPPDVGSASPPGAPAQPPSSGAPGSIDDAPITMGQFQALMAQQQESFAYQQAEAAARADIHAEVRALGYDPDASDPVAVAEFQTLLQLAVNLDGNIARAHEVMAAREQAAVAKYLDGKRADAQRVAPSGGTGQGPAPGSRKLETTADAKEAASARLAAAFGRDPAVVARGG